MTQTSRYAATAACLVLGAGDLVLLNLVVFPRALRGWRSGSAPLAVPEAARPVDPAAGVPAAAPVVPVVAAIAPPPAPAEPAVAPSIAPIPAPPPAESSPAPAPSAVYFATAAANLDPAARRAVDQLARRMASLLKEDRQKTIVIDGHADVRGDGSLNDRLSHRRALAVSARLKARGVTPARIVVRRFGATRPVATGSDPDSLRLNRRVEIIVGGGKS